LLRAARLACGSTGRTAPAKAFLESPRPIIETEFGTSYKRSGLDPKTRELVLIASSGGIGKRPELVRSKDTSPAALKAGATRLEIFEILVQFGFGAGLPTSIGALQALTEVF
jgi:4-carboxymuconolactone decarboxylase